VQLTRDVYTHVFRHVRTEAMRRLDRWGALGASGRAAIRQNHPKRHEQQRTLTGEDATRTGSYEQAVRRANTHEVS